MTPFGVLFLVCCAVIAVAYSIRVWTRPDEFIRDRQGARQRAYGLRPGFLFNNRWTRFWDHHPALGLWVYRVGWLGVYGFIMFLFAKLASGQVTIVR